MNRDEWLPIRYRDFHDVPRAFVVAYHGKHYLFDSPSDAESGEYPDTYDVYRLDPERIGGLEAGTWVGLSDGHEAIATVQLIDVVFDGTRRNAVHGSVLKRIVGSEHDLRGGMGNMSADRRFIRAWYDWERVPLPIDRFRAGNRRFRAYELECEIDHLSSWVYGLGTAYIGRSVRDFAWHAQSLLEDVHALERLADELDIAPAERAPYLRFLSSTRLVVEALAQSASPNTDGSDIP